MSKRRKNPFSNALAGIVETYRTERNFRMHLAAAVAVAGLGVWVDVARWEWYWIALCIALVLVAELLNTALEAWVDLAYPDDHPLAKKAKDAAAGAVLVAAAFSLAIGCLIFLPKLWTLFFGQHVA